MGLDMTMYAFEGDEVSFEELMEQDSKVWYWRKANQIHGWMVKNVQKGEDDCGLYHVNEQQIESLLDAVKYTLKTKKTTKLPPTSGFFFGTGVDEWYWEDLKDTRKYLQEMLTLKRTNPKTKFYYHSSW